MFGKLECLESYREFKHMFLDTRANYPSSLSCLVFSLLMLDGMLKLTMCDSREEMVSACHVSPSAQEPLGCVTVASRRDPRVIDSDINTNDINVCLI
jgi:hypothetical protein